ncbi:alpha/beta fold hydrolase [Pyxidicoccus fallax]|uniref:Alpha/beta fold hydrolase n=1 Tax=Pyxidicoccus fallax TaxID=394095 RepID=A0A848LIE9_9BACT|nr:alpha/beta fold hydrolase [Pyxidicoccus fallax]NMO17490.1 alpha/beta fold hydrolase [Pyxidicoccus fallax]NPC79617.1 alpha/beta fold hydrolase [Pyxidicoccus fallax]
MPKVQANGIELFYDEHGDPSAPPLLLVMGLGMQLLGWDERFVRLLAGRGFRVIRFDNRDTGLSTHLDGVRSHLKEVMDGDPSQAPYRLSDMARDAVGLMDALGIDSAHVVGASMGGMIVQTLAIEHPRRVRSLCSIMSTTGARNVGGATREAMAILMAPPGTDRESVLARAVVTHSVIGSKAYPVGEEVVRARAAAAFDRAFYPEGFARQLAAIRAGPDRTPALRTVSVPTLVIHGEDDTLVLPSGGDATAAAVPGAMLLRLPGMAHDFPEPLWPRIVDAIAENAVGAERARAQSAGAEKKL